MSPVDICPSHAYRVYADMVWATIYSESKRDVGKIVSGRDEILIYTRRRMSATASLESW